MSNRMAVVAEPAAVGVDLGSDYTRIWASGRSLLQAPTISDSLINPSRLIQRGRITDPASLESMLARLLRRHHRPVPAGAIIVACRPVLATAEEEAATRQVLVDVFNPSIVLLIDTVRAAAIGAGAAPGPLLVADIGAHLTEVAVLAGGTLTATRRADLGLRDLIGPSGSDLIVDTIGGFVDDLRHDPQSRDQAADAIGNGLLLVGGGAAQPALTARTAAALEMAVWPSATPRLAAVRGAGLAALAALRRRAATAA
ncbi:rod shape-determining protein [Micromonospora sp. CPCC 206061]|uniref:rod shape-determining protein n=1 Tax=Micromonospora sp. CPCC 206061 TaxID=3122410 RepID=UPI002FF1B7C6